MAALNFMRFTSFVPLLFFMACAKPDAEGSPPPKPSEPEPRQSFVIKVQPTNATSTAFDVLISTPESWQAKPIAQGLSTALFAAQAPCGAVDRNAPDHALDLKDGIVQNVHTTIDAPVSCLGNQLKGKTIAAAGQGFTGTVYLRTRIDG